MATNVGAIEGGDWQWAYHPKNGQSAGGRCALATGRAAAVLPKDEEGRAYAQQMFKHDALDSLRSVTTLFPMAIEQPRVKTYHCANQKDACQLTSLTPGRRNGVAITVRQGWLDKLHFFKCMHAGFDSSNIQQQMYKPLRLASSLLQGL
ncbi:hypothetical protein NYP20_14930 [Pseudomonas sp. N3-W]|uniref:hypothetical protein n=1 Tax=Pseudomonas sp. N3-W TaxID=2975049 RepID=UPI00217E4D9F|nr:hypothetical protein [Pseudomonas sp. N3-W]UWF52178.1 hypothetical protein NYP20_14930 [Pseudomonas sp. N3-W]